ncbi:Uncharacterized protein Fot_17092 [Forsythia ovata]|uniref:Uncharacterized protein n=1 Tax=Forsythia ovata TaxID=205694 RepID=A0ABD1VEP4_9LAMI
MGQVSRLAVTCIACYIHRIVSRPLVGPGSQIYLTMRLLEVAHTKPSASSWQQLLRGIFLPWERCYKDISSHYSLASQRHDFLWLITAIIMYVIQLSRDIFKESRGYQQV